MLFSSVLLTIDSTKSMFKSRLTNMSSWRIGIYDNIEKEFNVEVMLNYFATHCVHSHFLGTSFLMGVGVLLSYMYQFGVVRLLPLNRCNGLCTEHCLTVAFWFQTTLHYIFILRILYDLGKLLENTTNWRRSIRNTWSLTGIVIYLADHWLADRYVITRFWINICQVVRYHGFEGKQKLSIGLLNNVKLS